MATIKPAEVRKAFRDVRRHVATSLALLDAGDIDGAYREAEAAQHAAFDAKALIQSGGKYEGMWVGTPEEERAMAVIVGKLKD